MPRGRLPKKRSCVSTPTRTCAWIAASVPSSAKNPCVAPQVMISIEPVRPSAMVHHVRQMGMQRKRDVSGRFGGLTLHGGVVQEDKILQSTTRLRCSWPVISACLWYKNLHGRCEKNDGRKIRTCGRDHDATARPRRLSVGPRTDLRLYKTLHLGRDL